MSKKKQTTRSPYEKKAMGASPTPAKAPERKGGPHRLTIFGLALVGTALGFLSGVNQWPAQPAELTSSAAETAWFGAVLGFRHLDLQGASQGGLLGLVVSVGLGLSFAMNERRMLNTWSLALMGLLAGSLLLKTATAAAGGWCLGWLLASAIPSKEA